MPKKLSEMTLEELWQLFPIFLTEHDDRWNAWYHEEQQRLCVILSDMKVRISHIGSTAIEHIWAKPIIDILIIVNSIKELKQAASLLEKHGYITMSASENRVSLNKGYTENGFAEKVFHLHIRLQGDEDEIYFRDYLNLHPDIAKEYEQLKLNLCGKFKHNRDAYTEAKTDFVKRITDLAKQKG